MKVSISMKIMMVCNFIIAFIGMSLNDLPFAGVGIIGLVVLGCTSEILEAIDNNRNKEDR